MPKGNNQGKGERRAVRKGKWAKARRAEGYGNRVKGSGNGCRTGKRKLRARVKGEVKGKGKG